jgi:hypothetical protein
MMKLKRTLQRGLNIESLWDIDFQEEASASRKCCATASCNETVQTRRPKSN